MPVGDLVAAMKRNPVVTVGAILMKPAGMVTELTPVRLRTLNGICRKLMAPGLYRDLFARGRETHDTPRAFDKRQPDQRFQFAQAG